MEQKREMNRSRFDELQAELHYLKTTRSEEVEARIKAARDLGDLSENPAYDEAREEKRDITIRISELEDLLRHAAIAGEDGAPGGRG